MGPAVGIIEESSAGFFQVVVRVYSYRGFRCGCFSWLLFQHDYAWNRMSCHQGL